MLPESPRQSTGRRSFRGSTVWHGATIGLVIGAAWTAVFGSLTDGPPSVWLALAVYALGFAATGAVVGAIGRFPELVGLSAGFLILAAFAVIIGPKDGWIAAWIFVFGGSGLLWGFVIGLLARLFSPKMSSEPNA